MTRAEKRRLRMVVFMCVLYRERGSVWESIPESLVVILHAVRVDSADFHLRHAEGTQSAAHVVEVDDVVVREIGGLGFADGADIGFRTVLAHERGVTGADTAGAGTVILQVLDAHPPGVERGVEERSALPHGEGTGGEGEDDQVTIESGAHAYIVPHDRECV